MKRIWKTILFLLAIAWATIPALAQDPTTQGKEFWVSFLTNGYQYNPEEWLRIQLLVSAKRDCQGTITNPNTGWTHNFSVQANNIYSLELNPDQAYLQEGENEQIVNKGLKITTTDTVSVYCANIAIYSFDVSYVMPIEGLADDYIIQTFDQTTSDSNHTSAFLIVATEDNTTIDITPSVNTMGNKPAQQEFSVTLNQGQVYQVRSHHDNSGSRDLSGTRVTARDCKKIAIFNGNTVTRVPVTAGNDADCVFEQAMPVRSWGKRFVITTSLDRSKDYVKVTSAADGNEIRRNGNVICTLNAGESYTFMVSSSAKSCYLEATQRCAVYLFNSSSDGSNANPGNGAPSMLWIAPIEQRIEEITFSTFNYQHNNVDINNHYVNIIVETQDIGQVYLDNVLLPSSQFEVVEGNSRYSFYRKKIDHGVHQMHCPNGFNAHIYGFGQARGYAYMAGSKAADLTTSILVNDVAINPFDTIADCTLEDLSFLADINLIDYTLEWDFGDGTTSYDNPVSHHYAANGLYLATLTVTTEEPPCGGTSTTTDYSFYVDSRRDDDIEIYDTICFTQTGNYHEYGFDLPYDKPGQYDQALNVINESGCISRKTLHLTVNAINDLLPEHAYGKCDSFEWRGHTYTTTGHYTDSVINEAGCFTVHHLELALDYSPHPKISSADPNTVVFADTIAVVTNTEFFSFQYDFYVEDSEGHMDDWDSFDWHISKPSWAIQPYDVVGQEKRHYCKVYVAEHDAEYVKLWCTAHNHCQDNSAVFYLKPSFLGIDGNEYTKADFSVYPNPNSGAMDLNFEGFGKRVIVKIYDMHGTLLERIETTNDSGIHTLHYTMAHVTPGIYFFVAIAKEGTLARKVVVE